MKKLLISFCSGKNCNVCSSVSRILLSRISIFFSAKFDACFDLLKMDLILFENQNIQNKMSNKPFYHRKSQTIMIYLMKIRPKIQFLKELEPPAYHKTPSPCETKSSLRPGSTLKIVNRLFLTKPINFHFFPSEH
jgi:hypothetical protein